MTYNHAQMEQREHKPRLIGNRLSAIIGVVLTGYVAALTFRTAFSQSAHHSPWLLALDHLLPAWAGWLVSALFYAYLLWLCAVFSRAANGKERVLIAGWVPGLLLGPIQGRVSVSLAAGLQYVKAGSIAIAFIAAVLILLDAPARDQALSDGSVS